MIVLKEKGFVEGIPHLVAAEAITKVIVFLRITNRSFTAGGYFFHNPGISNPPRDFMELTDKDLPCPQGCPGISMETRRELTTHPGGHARYGSDIDTVITILLHKPGMEMAREMDALKENLVIRSSHLCTGHFTCIFFHPGQPALTM